MIPLSLSHPMSFIVLVFFVSASLSLFPPPSHWGMGRELSEQLGGSLTVGQGQPTRGSILGAHTKYNYRTGFCQHLSSCGWSLCPQHTPSPLLFLNRVKFLPFCSIGCVLLWLSALPWSRDQDLRHPLIHLCNESAQQAKELYFLFLSWAIQVSLLFEG